eukprot:scaffold97_cov261-Pinguiococcus_pyrenoidosus.AAC.32
MDINILNSKKYDGQVAASAQFAPTSLPNRLRFPVATRRAAAPLRLVSLPEQCLDGCGTLRRRLRWEAKTAGRSSAPSTAVENSDWKGLVPE